SGRLSRPVERAWTECRWLFAALMIGFALRLALSQLAPVLATGDSETYLGPAVALERGGALELSLKRTPGYPLFAAGSLKLFAEDLRGLAAAQHSLGLLSTALVFLISRRFMSRPAAGLAALTTTLCGNLLVYERMVMTECLFTSALDRKSVV